MGIGFKWLSVLLLIAVLVLAGCSGTEDQPSPTPIPTTNTDAQQKSAPTPTADPAVTVVKAYAERVNAGDYAGAAALFADDAMAYLVGMPPIGMEIYWGNAQYQAFLEACCTDQHFEMEVTVDRVEDGVVYAEAKTWMDFTRDLGVAPNSFHEIFVVREGKITLYHSTLTEEAWASFRPALAEVMPEAFEVVLPSGETPVTEVAITVADNTCAYDGPLTLQAGELAVNVNVEDQRFEKYAVSFFTLDEDKDLIDLMASTPRPGPPSWSSMVFIKELEPDENQAYENLYVEEGLLYMMGIFTYPPRMVYFKNSARVQMTQNHKINKPFTLAYPTEIYWNIPF